MIIASHRFRDVRWQAAGIAFIAMVVAVAIIFASPRLGPNDEEVHLDYVMKIGRLYVPAAGDPMDQDSLRIEACRGFYGPYQPPQVCSTAGPLDPAAFQFNGESRAWSHAPVYFGVTRILMMPLQIVGVDFLEAARIATAVWTAVALALLWMVLVRLRVDWRVAVSLLVIVMLNQAVMQRAVNVSNDATAVFSGALLLLLVTKTSRFWVLALAAFLVVLLKSQNMYAVICAMTACGIGVSDYVNRQSEMGTDTPLTSRAIRVVALIVGAITAVTMWRLFEKTGSTSVGESAAALVRTGGFPTLDDLSRLSAQNILSYSRPFQTVENYLPAYVKVPLFIDLDVVVNLALVGAAIAATLVYSTRSIAFRLAVPAVVGLIVAPPLMAVAIGMSIGSWAEWPPRYGLSVIPFIAVTVALAVGRRQGATVLAGIAGLYAVLLIVGLGLSFTS